MGILHPWSTSSVFCLGVAFKLWAALLVFFMFYGAIDAWRHA